MADALAMCSATTERRACVSVEDLALKLRQKGMAQRYPGGRDRTRFASRFATVRVHLAARGLQVSAPHPVEMAARRLAEGEAARTEYWLSTLPEDMPLATLVHYAKLRWRIERDYEELKGEIRLEPLRRSRLAWLSPSCHALHRRLRFSISERDAIPPSASRRRTMPRLPNVIDPRRRRSVPNATSKTSSRRSKRLTVALAKSLVRCPSPSVDAPTTCNPDCVS